MRRSLLICGILSSVVYVAANVIVPARFPGYDVTSQTVSELSAIGAPTRGLWLAFMVPYALLAVAFSVGIWLSAGESRPCVPPPSSGSSRL